MSSPSSHENNISVPDTPESKKCQDNVDLQHYSPPSKPPVPPSGQKSDLGAIRDYIPPISIPITEDLKREMAIEQGKGYPLMFNKSNVNIPIKYISNNISLLKSIHIEYINICNIAFYKNSNNDRFNYADKQKRSCLKMI